MKNTNIQGLIGSIVFNKLTKNKTLWINLNGIIGLLYHLYYV